MDSSELDEHSFNEKELFYDVRERNKRVLEKKSGPQLEEKAPEKKSEVDSISQEELVHLFLEYQKSMPGLTLKDFISMVESGKIAVRKEQKQ
jgi:hypothetical protein